MHKGVILLVKADSVSDAKGKAVEFLEDYGDGNVWDWYNIGGRWSGLLSDRFLKFVKLAKKCLKKKFPDVKPEFINNNMVKECDTELQSIWVKLGGAGVHPYNRNTYTSNPFYDDIVPMAYAMTTIKKWAVDPKKMAEKNYRLILKARREKKKNPSGYDMSGYYANIYANWNYDNFSFDSNVYDIEHGTNSPEKAIEELDTYYAIIVDMHN